MITHTKGPFSIGQDCTNLLDKDCRSENGRFVAIDAPGHGALAIVVVRMEDDEADNPRLLGNLALFAAAPELLAACQAQHKAIDYLMARLIEANTGFMPTESKVWPTILSANATILKATGGAQ